MKLNVRLTKKEIGNQLNNFQKKSDLRIINMQKNIQKAAAALVRVTDDLLEANCNIKESVKRNLGEICITRPFFTKTSEAEFSTTPKIS